MINVLKIYEAGFGQLIFKKSVFLFYHKTTHAHIREMKECTNFNIGKFPLIYLGFPIGHAKKKKVHFLELMKKMHNKLQAWKGKMFLFGCKVVLINNALNRTFIIYCLP